jgi:hypothetical protein
MWAFGLDSIARIKGKAQGEANPDSHGWVDADNLGVDGVVVHGGLGEANNQLTG